MDTSMELLQQNNSQSEVYQSDNFRLYCHKILPCSKRTPHDWASCPFAHPGEKAKRRNIRTHQYDCEMCPAVVKGEECKLGSNCPHSHNVFESWLHPQKYRTMMCKDRDKCARPVCFFAHGPKELRTPTDAGPLLQQQLDRPSSAVAMPGSSSEQVMAAMAIESQNSAAAAAMAAAAAGSMSSSSWSMQSQQVLLQTMAHHLARATSNTSAMSSTAGGSGPATPTGNVTADASPAAAAAAAAYHGLAMAAQGSPYARAAGLPTVQQLQLLSHLMQDANATGRQQEAAASQTGQPPPPPQQQQQQQLTVMGPTAAASSTLPVVSASTACGGKFVRIGSQGGAAALLQLPLQQLVLSPQQQGPSAELLPATSSVGACMLSGGPQGSYLAVDCSDASSNSHLSMQEASAANSSNMSELSASLPLLSADQVAQLYGMSVAPGAMAVRTDSGIFMKVDGGVPMRMDSGMSMRMDSGVPMRMDSTGSSGSLMWPPQLGRSASGVVAVSPSGPGRLRLQAAEAGLAGVPVGGPANAALRSSSQGMVMQQRQQQGAPMVMPGMPGVLWQQASGGMLVPMLDGSQGVAQQQLEQQQQLLFQGLIGGQGGGAGVQHAAPGATYYLN